MSKLKIEIPDWQQQLRDGEKLRNFSPKQLMRMLMKLTVEEKEIVDLYLKYAEIGAALLKFKPITLTFLKEKLELYQNYQAESGGYEAAIELLKALIKEASQ